MPIKPFPALLACCCTAALFACIPAASSSLEQTIVQDSVSPPLRDDLTPSPVNSSQEIVGDWDIVSFDGHEPARMNGTTRTAFADFSLTGVRLRIECNYSGAAGEVVNGRFVAGENDGVQTAMGCGPEREDRETQLFAFFRNDDPRAERLSDDRLRLTGKGHELLLERPARRRLAYLPSAKDLLGEWRLLQITRYDGQGGWAGIGLSETPGRLVFDGITASYSRCPQYGLSYRYTVDGRIEKTAGAALPPEPTGCGELVEAMHGTDMPVPWDVMRVLHSNPVAERVDDGGLLLSNDQFGLLLTQEKCEMLEQSNDHRVTRMVDCASPR